MESHQIFIGIEYPLVYYNGKSVYNQQFEFLAEDGETDFDFTDFSTIQLDIYTTRKRNRRLIKSFDAEYLTQSGNDIFFNASAGDMEFQDEGKYYYEMYYIQSGGYEVILIYGEFNVI